MNQIKENDEMKSFAVGMILGMISMFVFTFSNQHPVMYGVGFVTCGFAIFMMLRRPLDKKMQVDSQ